MSSDSFLDDILKKHFADRQPTSFSITECSTKVLKLAPGCEVTDVIFQRKG